MHRSTYSIHAIESQGWAHESRNLSAEVMDTGFQLVLLVVDRLASVSHGECNYVVAREKVELTVAHENRVIKYEQQGLSANVTLKRTPGTLSTCSVTCYLTPFSFK